MDKAFVEEFARFLPPEVRDEGVEAFVAGSARTEAIRKAKAPSPVDPSAESPGYHYRALLYGAQAEAVAEIARRRAPDPVALIGEPAPPPSSRRERRRTKRSADKRWKAKLHKEGRRQERQRDRWSEKLAQRGWHCPNPRVVTARMWQGTQLAMGEELDAPRALLAELPVKLAEAFFYACQEAGIDLLTNKIYRRHLGTLVFLWRGSRSVKRPGFLRGTFGYSRGLIGACLPKPGTWGKGYRLTAAKESITWLVRAGLIHRHQPPHAEYFTARGLPDPLPNWARGSSGQAYNEYWFANELTRGPQGDSHRRAGLWAFSDEVRDWILDMDSEAERATCEREARAELEESAQAVSDPSNPSRIEREGPIQGASGAPQSPDSPFAGREHPPPEGTAQRA